MLELTNCSKDQGYSNTIDIDQVENCQKEFAIHLNLAPSTISHHFKELRLAGLLKMQKQGKNIIFSVNDEVINTIKKLF